jgi:hypothetical protein
LEQIQKYFGVGKIFTKKDNSISYLVTSVKELQVIIKHFENYPLITKKRGDFELFKLAILLLEIKEHLTTEGLNKLVSIRASMNLGFTEILQKAFPNVAPYNRLNN